jgi:hypothetical protein
MIKSRGKSNGLARNQTLWLVAQCLNKLGYRIRNLCRIWGSHSSGHKEFNLLGYILQPWRWRQYVPSQTNQYANLPTSQISLPLNHKPAKHSVCQSVIRKPVHQSVCQSVNRKPTNQSVCQSVSGTPAKQSVIRKPSKQSVCQYVSSKPVKKSCRQSICH